MEFSVYIVLFLIFSFIGFILDSIFCSIRDKKLAKSGYISYLPLCPLYGFGGLLLFSLQRTLGFLPWYLLVAVGVVVTVIAEYVGGVYCVTFLKEKLWDYKSEKWNLDGHISAQHSFYWVIVVFLFVKFLFPVFLRLETHLSNSINLNRVSEWAFLVLFIFVFVSLSYVEFRKRQLKK